MILVGKKTTFLHVFSASAAPHHYIIICYYSY